jgi:hypothetical protein
MLGVGDFSLEKREEICKFFFCIFVSLKKKTWKFLRCQQQQNAKYKIQIKGFAAISCISFGAVGLNIILLAACMPGGSKNLDSPEYDCCLATKQHTNFRRFRVMAQV